MEEKKPVKLMATEKEIKQIHGLANIIEIGVWLWIIGAALPFLAILAIAWLILFR